MEIISKETGRELAKKEICKYFSSKNILLKT